MQCNPSQQVSAWVTNENTLLTLGGTGVPVYRHTILGQEWARLDQLLPGRRSPGAMAKHSDAKVLHRADLPISG